MNKMEKINKSKWQNSSQTNNSQTHYYDRLYKDTKFDVQYPVLDIGGGNGSFLDFIKVKEADILDLDGFDYILPNYNFIETDLTKELPNLNKKYKTIFIMETLEHLHNPLYLLANARKYLEESGCIYISVPYTPLFIKYEHELDMHVCRWTDKELEDQCKKLGYETEWIVKRRRFKDTAFWLPHCFLILKLKLKEVKNG